MFDKVLDIGVQVFSMDNSELDIRYNELCTLEKSGQLTHDQSIELMLIKIRLMDEGKLDDSELNNNDVLKDLYINLIR